MERARLKIWCSFVKSNEKKKIIIKTSGVPSAYATFVGYDEVAHHSGVETHDAFDALHKIDQQFARLESAAEKGP